MRITAARVGRLTVTAADVRPNLDRRQLAGTLLRYGEVGNTSAGPLRVDDPGALTFPADLTSLPLTLEHDRPYTVRGHLAVLDDNDERIYIVAGVSDDEDGDAALQEAADRTRAAFSFDLEDAEVRDGVIVAGRVVAIGQVREPAYNSARIDQIAASQTPATQGENMTEEQRRRLAELRAQETLTQAEAAELAQLAALEADENAGDDGEDEAEEEDNGQQPAGQQVAASVPAVPSGVPRRRAPARTRSRSLQQVVREVTAALAPGGGGPQAITAALSDIVNSDHVDTIQQPAWSGELWSGLAYEPEFTSLLNSGTLTNWNGQGWRFTKKLGISDYAGDKAAIPSDTVTTESSSYEAARMAVGVDIDRKFYDFPNEGFVNSLFEQVRESWTMQLDAKVRAWIVSNAVPVLEDDGVTPTAEATLLKAAARAMMALKRRKVGKATFIVVNDEDYFTLLDMTEFDVPAFLNLWGINPANFVSSDQVAAGKVLAGVRQTGTVRTLPGSPVRVSAQNLANGGVDEAFFGYWAIEEHHTSGIASVAFQPA